MTRRALLLCLGMALAAAAVAAVHAGPTGLVVTGASSNGPTIHVTVSNPTSQTLSGFLVLQVTLQGSSGPSVTSIPLTLPSESTADVDATYGECASLESIGLSPSPRGSGITESPDPIVTVKIVRHPPE